MKFKILIIDERDNVREVEGYSVPQIGSRIDMGYSPLCAVKYVIMYPTPQTMDTLSRFGVTGEYEAIVSCG